MNNQQRIIDIMSSSDVIRSIEKNKKELFGFIDSDMIGCEHVRYHYEGDVWEHTKLVIKSIVKQPHDWTDVLTALLHDMGKKAALIENQGQNMNNHAYLGSIMADEWMKKMGIDDDIREKIVWVIMNHMILRDLGRIPSTYHLWVFVKHPLFDRLLRLGRADFQGNLGPSGQPILILDDVLAIPRVARCISNDIPAPIVTKEDLESKSLTPIELEDLLSKCHRIQINESITSKEELINRVCKDF